MYTVVARALRGDPDLDDVVQDAMLRAVRDLPTLRDPSQFRAWLMAIAVRQVSTHLHRRRVASARVAPLDDAVEVPFEDLTMLHAVLSEQRRQVARAGGWLDPADRMLLSLWWLEQAGQLTRHELAEAAGVRGAHMRVRLQRMREQLELSRSIVAALEAAPRCRDLDAAAAGWNGLPSALWRKRLARHVRSCAVCDRAGAGQVPTERLLDYALLPVPASLAAAVMGGGGSTGVAKTSLIAKVISAPGALPIAISAAVGLAAVVAFAVPWSPATPPPPPPQATAAAAGLPVGPISLEMANRPGQYAATARDLGVLIHVDADSADAVQRGTTFDVSPGIADSDCFTLRAADGQYLRHLSWRLRSSPAENTPLFRGDATFCARPGALPGSVSLEASNYPGWFLRHVNGQLWVDRSDGSAAFQADSSFLVREPWAR